MDKDLTILALAFALLFGCSRQAEKPRNEAGSGSGSVLHLRSAAEFDQLIQADKLTLVDFYADWCGPCRALAPILERIARRYPHRLQVVKVNIDKHQVFLPRYGIRAIPALFFFRKGKLLHKSVGLPRGGESALRQQVERFLE